MLSIFTEYDRIAINPFLAKIPILDAHESKLKAKTKFAAESFPNNEINPAKKHVINKNIGKKLYSRFNRSK
jgi:hypothetical protein